MLTHLRRSIVASIVFIVLLGFGYNYAGLAVSRVFFAHQANGSIGKNGSPLIGQNWTGPHWFQGRPDSDNPLSTGAANLGPRSKLLVSDVAKQIAVLKREGIAPTADLVTTSGSGIDPDISPADAYDQVKAVADSNRLPVWQVRHLVDAHVHGRQLGILGSPYVNVLELNEALAAEKH